MKPQTEVNYIRIHNLVHLYIQIGSDSVLIYTHAVLKGLKAQLGLPHAHLVYDLMSCTSRSRTNLRTYPLRLYCDVEIVEAYLAPSSQPLLCCAPLLPLLQPIS